MLKFLKFMSSEDINSADLFPRGEILAYALIWNDV